MTATFVKDVSMNFTGTAKLYRVDPPVQFGEDQESEFVVASATVAMFSGPETYLFPADAEGNVQSWIELSGSFRGDLDCDRAIREQGYELA